MNKLIIIYLGGKFDIDNWWKMKLILYKSVIVIYVYYVDFIEQTISYYEITQRSIAHH